MWWNIHMSVRDLSHSLMSSELITELFSAWSTAIVSEIIPMDWFSNFRALTFCWCPYNVLILRSLENTPVPVPEFVLDPLVKMQASRGFCPSFGSSNSCILYFCFKMYFFVDLCTYHCCRRLLSHKQWKQVQHRSESRSWTCPRAARRRRRQTPCSPQLSLWCVATIRSHRRRL